MKICIDPGHGGSDPGAVFGIHFEKDINLSVASLVNKHATILGFVCYMTREGDDFVSLRRRAQIANSNQADLFLSIHCNADADADAPGMPEATGSEIWIYPNSVAGGELARCIGRALKAFFPNRPWRGVKSSANLAVLRQTSMPAILVEIGFIDSPGEQLGDARIQNMTAEAVISGLNEFCRLRGSHA